MKVTEVGGSLTDGGIAPPCHPGVGVRGPRTLFIP